MVAVPRRVPVRYLLLLADVLRASGADPVRVLERAGIDTGRLDQRDNTMTAAEADAFILAATQLTGRHDLGFELGRRVKMNSHDLLGYGLMSCPDMDAFLRMTCRHYHLMLETWMVRYTRGGPWAEMAYTPLVAMPPASLTFFLEALAMAHQNQMKLILGPELSVYDIHVSMPAPEHARRYEALFPARFHFHSGAMPGVRVVMPVAMLDTPLALGDVDVMRQIDERCQALGQRPARADTGWTDYVTMVLRETRGAQVTLEDIARKVHVSARTIDRHLKQEGSGFRELSDQVRFGWACELLRAPGGTIAEAALQLGFSDTANFARAFRRVMGTSPGEYQRGAPR